MMELFFSSGRRHTSFDCDWSSDVCSSDLPKQAPYLRGCGLQITAIAPAAVDLTNPVQDFDATIDLPDAELPDLRVYDALLPAERSEERRVGKEGRRRLSAERGEDTTNAAG